MLKGAIQKLGAILKCGADDLGAAHANAITSRADYGTQLAMRCENRVLYRLNRRLAGRGGRGQCALLLDEYRDGFETRERIGLRGPAEALAQLLQYRWERGDGGRPRAQLRQQRFRELMALIRREPWKATRGGDLINPRLHLVQRRLRWGDGGGECGPKCPKVRPGRFL